MFIPEISASKLAGLIGVHPYQDAHEVAYEILCKDKLIKARIADIERAHNRRPFSAIVNEVLREDGIRECVNKALRDCRRTDDVMGVLENVESQASVLLHLRHPEYTPDIREQLVAEVRGKVSKQRGLQNENHILNKYETERDVKVVERNTKMIRKEYGKFRLIGRLDGFVESENRIVDSKDRTRVWDSVPVYDEIQLRCYMSMTGAAEAELIERFPNGETRHTKFYNEPEKWKTLQSAVERAVESMNKALATPEELKRIVFANTVCVASNGDGGASSASST
jgi:hypothetical protein